MQSMDDAAIGKLVQRTFFIKNTARKNLAGEVIPSLYVEDVNSQQEEVCENIQQFLLFKQSFCRYSYLGGFKT
ncbi:MAG: hypothetical protein LRY69_04965 [Gammaproteobacteria bacterium]|nr:hypothetical protein [Gammaproteobacteria bacterium]